jgi:hypothetical protein
MFWMATELPSSTVSRIARDSARILLIDSLVIEQPPEIPSRIEIDVSLLLD